MMIPKPVSKIVKDMPILLPDGTEKKTARIQFKELVGLSLSFRF